MADSRRVLGAPSCRKFRPGLLHTARPLPQLQPIRCCLRNIHERLSTSLRPAVSPFLSSCGLRPANAMRHGAGCRVAATGAGSAPGHQEPVSTVASTDGSLRSQADGGRAAASRDQQAAIARRYLELKRVAQEQRAQRAQVYNIEGLTASDAASATPRAKDAGAAGRQLSTPASSAAGASTPASSALRPHVQKYPSVGSAIVPVSMPDGQPGSSTAAAAALDASGLPLLPSALPSPPPAAAAAPQAPWEAVGTPAIAAWRGAEAPEAVASTGGPAALRAALVEMQRRLRGKCGEESGYRRFPSLVEVIDRPPWLDNHIKTAEYLVNGAALVAFGAAVFAWARLWSLKRGSGGSAAPTAVAAAAPARNRTPGSQHGGADQASAAAPHGAGPEGAAAGGDAFASSSDAGSAARVAVEAAGRPAGVALEPGWWRTLRRVHYVNLGPAFGIQPRYPLNGEALRDPPCIVAFESAADAEFVAGCLKASLAAGSSTQFSFFCCLTHPGCLPCAA